MKRTAVVAKMIRRILSIDLDLVHVFEYIDLVERIDSSWARTFVIGEGVSPIMLEDCIVACTGIYSLQAPESTSSPWGMIWSGR